MNFENLMYYDPLTGVMSRFYGFCSFDIDRIHHIT